MLRDSYRLYAGLLSVCQYASVDRETGHLEIGLLGFFWLPAITEIFSNLEEDTSCF
jgi:hypothetical protein